MMAKEKKEPIVPPDVLKIAKKHNIEIPYEGLEPGETPETAQPDVIEYAGVHWATTTTDRWCKAFFEDPNDYEKCVVVMLPKMLAKRNEWEKKTWEGIKRFIETTELVKETLENDM